MTEDHTRALARLLAYAAAFSLVGVSIAMNLQAGIAKSDTLAGQITWAAASVAADVLKAVTPILLIWAIARRDVLRSLAAVAVLTVTAGYSLVSAITYSHGSRVDVAIERGAEAGTYERAKSAYSETEKALSSLAPARTTQELDAKIAVLLADPLTGNCAKIDGPVTRRVCPTVAYLRAERAIAAERARLQTELKSEQTRLDGMPPPKLADPSADAITRLWAQIGNAPAAERVSLWLGLASVLLVEIGSTFGLLLASGLDVPKLSEAAVAEKEKLPEPGTEPVEAKQEDQPDNSEPVVSQSEPPSPLTTKRKRGRPVKAPSQSLEKLKALARNGRVAASHSSIATALGVSKATAHRQLRSLAKTGALRLKTGKRGTLIRLM